jgi:hypothetical protein
VLPVLKEYTELLAAFLRMTRPRWIQFNGSTGRPLIEALLGTELESAKIIVGDGKAQHFYAGWCSNPKITDTRIPVLVHGFTNKKGGPQSFSQFKAVADAFERWVSESCIASECLASAPVRQN